MKKLIISAAVILTAVATNAASITWGALNVKTPVASDAKVDQTGIVGSGATMANLAVNLYWVNSSGNDVFIGTFTTGTGSDAGKIASVELGVGTSSDLYQAMLADHGESWKPQYHFTATYTTDDGVYAFSGNSTATKGLGDVANYNVGSTANFSTAGTWTYTAKSTDDVPEPTSAMLLLLGAAGMALKRRRV